jgi:hypothetical protein
LIPDATRNAILRVTSLPKVADGFAYSFADLEGAAAPNRNPTIKVGSVFL